MYMLCTIRFAFKRLDHTLCLQVHYAFGCVIHLLFSKAFQSCLCPKHPDKYIKLQLSQQQYKYIAVCLLLFPSTPVILIKGSFRRT